MKILALEFSSPQRSVAVVQAECGVSSAEGSQPTLDTRHSTLDTRLSEAIETGSVATQAVSMIETVLREAALEREQIECLAVGLGPGSYTGIRLAIALAQGWQLASSRVRVLGISSVECIVAQAQADGIVGRLAVAIDAQRGEFYLASYDLAGTTRQEISPLRLASRDEVQARADAGETLIGPEVTKWFPNGRIVFPRAAMLGQVGLARNDFQPAETLTPIYLRETKFVKAPKPRLPAA